MRPWLAIALSGCDRLVDLDDCAFFDECEWYTPAGTNCGLAAEGANHQGGSCLLEHDPALTFTEGNIPHVAAGRSLEGRCPEDFDDDGLLDEDVSTNWWTCSAEGNRDRSSGDLRDVPAGTTCGLSNPRFGQGSLCEEADPADGQCPDGLEFRWVLERGVLGEDEQCNSLDGPSGEAFDFVVRVIAFCVVKKESGCTDDCPEDREYDGLLCGLHVRDLAGAAPLDLETAILVDQAASPAEETALQYLDRCASHQTYLTDSLMAALHTYARENLRPMCRGQDVAAEGCPDPLELVCTIDDMSPEQEAEYPTLCWCDNPLSLQDGTMEP